MFNQNNQTEVKTEFAEITCKREINYEVDEVLQDTFKTEIKEEPIRESTNDKFVYLLDVKKCPIKAEIDQDDGLSCKDMKTDVSNLFTNDDRSDSNLNQRTTSTTNVNTEGQSFICIICQKPLSSHSHLEVHMRIHTGDKPFECEICAKHFSTKSYLSMHMKLHTGEKPFEC
uniref:Zinc finger protein 583-like n=1 Tax=Diabrotica virgifera virgifera TaxID=50390 RepID=A0A6P7G249_DIAVI